MKKLKLTQAEIDKLVAVDRVAVLPTVCGVGFNDVDFRINIGKKAIWQYKLWTGMLGRSFSDKLKLRRPSYQDVTVCDEWLYFGNFLGWVNREVDYAGKPDGLVLDKDLIISGNKTYSPEACSFVPDAINTLVIDRGSERGEWPIGVCFHNLVGKFTAQLNSDGKRLHLGCYDKPEDAFAAYKIAKEANIKVVALRYKDVLKSTVFESLMNWEISIDR